MILPALQGSLRQDRFFVYAVADQRYFDLYGRALANSTLANSDHGLHLHLFDPTDQQLEFCAKNPRISVTWEYIDPTQLQRSWDFWARWDLPEPWATRKIKMLALKGDKDNSNLESWLRKTYYACMRFVRLAEIVDRPRRFLEVDIDGIVRKSFVTVMPDDDVCDVYLYEKFKKDKSTRQLKHNGYLAGSILFTDKTNSWNFIQELAQNIRVVIEADHMYWFLDQDCLAMIAPRYCLGKLPIDYVDWHMQPDSAIWTAKGRRKELEVFQRELDRYR